MSTVKSIDVFTVQVFDCLSLFDAYCLVIVSLPVRVAGLRMKNKYIKKADTED